MALKPDSYAFPLLLRKRKREKEATTCRGAWGPRDEARARAGVERPLVQILVGVAIIQVRVLKTEEEKGSVRSAMRHR